LDDDDDSDEDDEERKQLAGRHELEAFSTCVPYLGQRKRFGNRKTEEVARE